MHPRMKALTAHLASLDEQIRGAAAKNVRGLDSQARIAGDQVASLNAAIAEQSRTSPPATRTTRNCGRSTWKPRGSDSTLNPICRDTARRRRATPTTRRPPTHASSPPPSRRAVRRSPRTGRRTCSRRWLRLSRRAASHGVGARGGRSGRCAFAPSSRPGARGPNSRSGRAWRRSRLRKFSPSASGRRRRLLRRPVEAAAARID